MRPALLLVLLFLCSIVSATTYYIDPLGNDSNSGSAEYPWKTLSYACANAIEWGDTIYVNAGTYLETTRCDLAKGVSIVGTGDSSHIISHFVTTGQTNGLLKLESSIDGTDGHQDISYIKLDGELIGTIGIYIIGRSNVRIHNCTIVNFDQNGIGFRGGYSSHQPTVYAKGNEIYNCIIENSSTRGDVSNGLIKISGQEGMLIHDNILIQTGKPKGQNGNIIDAVAGYNKGIKYYRNKSYKPESEGSGWNFHIESWNSLGGIEIYENEFHGGGCHINVAGYSNIKGNYDYSWWIHDNLFNRESQKERIPDEPSVVGISFEGTNLDAIVSENHFRNLPFGVYCTIGQSNRQQKNITICNNLFENMGHADSYWSFAIYLSGTEGLAIPPEISEFYIYNNTITSGRPGKLTGGIHIRKNGKISNIEIKNNIIGGCLHAYYINDGPGSVSNISTYNNILFENDNNCMYKPQYISDYLNADNLVVDPLFTSNESYTLCDNSPAIDGGIDLGLPFCGMAPDIGYAEYSSGPYILSNPVILNATIENATPSKLELSFNLVLSNIVPDLSAISVKANSTTRSIKSVAISGRKVTVLLNSPVKYGESITVSYSKPNDKPFQSLAGAPVASLIAQSVKNNVKPEAPVFVTALVDNSMPAKIDIAFSAALAVNSVPSPSSFAVKVNSISRDISTVSVSGTQVTLSIATPVVYNDMVTVSYTKPTSNPLQSTEGGLVATFSAKTVTNNCTAPAAAMGNEPPVIKSFSSSTKGSTLLSPAMITMSIEAYDPDGSIQSVTLLSGNNKLEEKTTPPYSFVLKDLQAGSYFFHALVTDNLKSTATSEVLEFQVISPREELNKSFSLFPNPNDGRFTIKIPELPENDEYFITIYNLTGIKELESELSLSETSKQLDLSHVQPGCYILMISGTEILLTEQFVKK